MCAPRSHRSLNENPSAKNRLLPHKLLVRETTKPLPTKENSTGSGYNSCPSKLDGESLVLKTPPALMARHRSIKLELRWKLLPAGYWI